MSSQTTPTKQPGIRERKKQRTKRAILEVGARLFLEQGYEQTTLAQIAEEVDVAPSTFFNYFPTKSDLVFSFFDAYIESARRRITDRPAGERTLDAIIAWYRDDLPKVEQSHAESMLRMADIIESTPQLLAEKRLRFAHLEDVLAEGFGRDLGESSERVRPRLLAVAAFRGMVEARAAWQSKFAPASDHDPHYHALLETKAAYVANLVESTLTFVETLRSLDSNAD